MSARTSDAAGARTAVALTVALACSIAVSWARIRFNSVYLPGALENVAGLDPRGAAEPFAHRILVPALVRWLHERLPFELEPLAIFRWIDALSVFAAFLAVRRLARDVLRRPLAIAWAPFGLFPLLCIHYVLSREYPFWYAWDMSGVAFFTWGLCLMRERRWVPYYALFALATFNRETTCFLTFALMFTGLRTLPKAQLAGHGLAQLALWLAVKAALRATFRRQPGDVFQPAWIENSESLADPAMWKWFLLAFGGLWLVLPFVRRRIADDWLRDLVWVLPVFALAMFFVGVWTELRIWGELIPIVLLSAVAGLGGGAREVAAPAGSGTMVG